jgi:hypothetical protein
MRNSVFALAVTVVLAVAFAASLAWSRPKSSPGCPRRTPDSGSPCKHKHATCHFRCEGEGHSDLGCVCEKDEQGAWRWQCSSAGPPCTL